MRPFRHVSLLQSSQTVEVIGCTESRSASWEQTRYSNLTAWMRQTPGSERRPELATNMPIAAYAEVERAGAALLARTAGRQQARRPFERALRLLAAVGGIASRMDAAASYIRTMKPINERLRRHIDTTPHDLTPLLEGSQPRRSAKALETLGPVSRTPGPRVGRDLLPLVTLAGRADLCAREAFVALRESGRTTALAVIERQGSQVLSVPCHEGWSADQAARATERRTGVIPIRMGAMGEREFDLMVVPKNDSPARVFVHSFKAFVGHMLTLQSLREKERAQSAVFSPSEFVTCEDGVFASQAIVRLLAKARLAAATDYGVLITGETGTGKEVLARLVHKYSARSSRDFVPFNCTSVPLDVVESQLFGHRKGSFTGATDDAPGVIRGATGGTLFLDEIGDLNPAVQPKLLRFLDSKEVHPLGEARPVKANVRIIAASNANIDRLVQNGHFREDLFYRLNIFRLDVPPLRERREEIPVLVHHFLRLYASEVGRPPLAVDDDALKCLLLHEWPGNVRMLANEVRRAMAMANRARPDPGRAPLTRNRRSRIHHSRLGIDHGFSGYRRRPGTRAARPTTGRRRGRYRARGHHEGTSTGQRAPNRGGTTARITRKGLSLKCERLGIGLPTTRLGPRHGRPHAKQRLKEKAPAQ